MYYYTDGQGMYIMSPTSIASYQEISKEEYEQAKELITDGNS